MTFIQGFKNISLMFKHKKLCFIGSLIIIYFSLSNSSKAQPYLDILNLKYTNSPNTGLLNQQKNAVNIVYFNMGINLPVQLKNKKDALVFSPFFESWSSQIQQNKRQNYYGIGLPVSLSKSIPGSRWNFLLTGIVRMNDSCLRTKGPLQVGGAFIAAYKRNQKLTWKFGLYVNNENFGLFVMPLLGIDWRITSRDNLFGILPGNLTYEHKLNKHFYYGANFRAITNSYAKTNGYWRIDENQLGIYLDTYFNKNLVLNIEAGHSIFRKIRSGIKGISTFDEKVNDNLYLKISFLYRVRFTN